MDNPIRSTRRITRAISVYKRCESYKEDDNYMACSYCPLGKTISFYGLNTTLCSLLVKISLTPIPKDFPRA